MTIWLTWLEANKEMSDLCEEPCQTFAVCKYQSSGYYFKLISISNDLKDSFEQGRPAAPLGVHSYPSGKCRNPLELQILSRYPISTAATYVTDKLWRC